MHLEELLKKASERQNKISIQDIYNLNITENEYESLIQELSNRGIIIEDNSDKIENNKVSTLSSNNDFYSSNDLKTYLKEIGKYSLLTKEEEKMLFEKYKNGDQEARKRLLESNLRLVVKVAKGIMSLNSTTSFDFLDLIQEGNIGLMTAIDKFDVTKGYKFSTYATWWIRQSISRALTNKSRTIRIPSYKIEQINRIKKYKDSFFITNGREPSCFECSKALHLTQEQIGEYLNLTQNIVSLETPVGDKEDTYLYDVIEVNGGSDISSDVTNQLGLTELIQIIKDVTTPREFNIVMSRLGLQDGKEYTLEETGKMFGLSKERIRQIENKAKQKAKKRYIYLEKQNEASFSKTFC